MTVNNEFLDFYVLMCQIISKPHRLKILYTIGKKKVNVSDLQSQLDIPMSNLSNHLNALYRAGVLGKEKRGNFVYYYLTVPRLLEGITRMQNIIKLINVRRNGISLDSKA